eukprot:13893858-Alexandrium_andersonii.AAC.1
MTPSLSQQSVDQEVLRQRGSSLPRGLSATAGWPGFTACPNHCGSAGFLAPPEGWHSRRRLGGLPDRTSRRT